MRRNGVSREAREAAMRRFNIPAVAPGAPATPRDLGNSESEYAIRKLPPDVEVTVQQIGGSDGVKRKLTLFKPSGRTQW